MRMPGATWKPVCNYSGGQIGHVIGCVVHHMVSSEEAAYSHFDSPGSGASAHFGVTYEGVIFQYVDTADAAYHACGANYAGQVGIENESASSGDLWQPLTDEQVSACGRILAWLHDAHGVELRVADINDRRGVGYHSMVPGPCTANDWGSTGCPGDNIIAQRAEMVRQAQGGGDAPEPEDDDMQLVLFAISGGIYVSNGITYRWVVDGWDLNALHTAWPNIRDLGAVNGFKGFGVPADPTTAELSGQRWPAAGPADN